ncbi:hypothetical protein S2091_1539 [Solimicrobium silvestre]|uniref:Uncharacterized protein n=1 Tax=Solimicrobium silvestre TaxID=2099400 RepID=A0A2S9H1V2_9BURK|nr:hypothetical protein S2091_1539 [Solimicrobium silvestre]
MLNFQHVGHAVAGKIAHYRLGVRAPIACLIKSTSGAIPRTHHRTTVGGDPACHNIGTAIAIGIRQLVRRTCLPCAEYRIGTLGIDTTLRIRIPDARHCQTLRVLPNLHQIRAAIAIHISGEELLV